MDMPIYSTTIYCRACGDDKLQTILELGDHVLTNYSPDTNAPMLKAPLTLLRCDFCGLVQLKEVVRQELLYGGTYFYQSSLNKTMAAHLKALMETIAQEAELGPGEIAVDIGANDGGQLASLDMPGLLKVGFEPSQNLSKEAARKGIYVINNLFNAVLYDSNFNRRAQAISAIAMFYDVPNPTAFLVDVEHVLDINGVFVIEMNTLYTMVKTMAYDSIGHEHVCYWPMSALERILSRVGLRIYRVEEVAINGGSLRFWIDKRGHDVEESVGRQRDIERLALTHGALLEFGAGVHTQTQELHDWVEKAVAEGEHVWILGASTRGDSILQAARLDHRLIEGASEIHHGKIGKLTAGTHIPIFHEDEARKRATVFLVLPYGFKEAFITQEKAFLDNGGRLLFPLPRLEVVSREGVSVG